MGIVVLLICGGLVASFFFGAYVEKKWKWYPFKVKEKR